MPFQSKVTRARFVLGPFTAEEMQTIGGVLVDSISTGIRKALKVNDGPAKALKPGRNGRRGYPDDKAAHCLMPMRDWVWTGRTLRSLKVKSANENQTGSSIRIPTALPT